MAVSFSIRLVLLLLLLFFNSCFRYERNGTAVAILFRGLPNANERDFSEWVNNLGYQPFAYVGGIVPRNEVEPNVSEGAQDDSSITFEPHNEMAYSPRYPKVLYLYFDLSYGVGFSLY